MRIRVLFFGILKDVVGRAQDEVELGAGQKLADLFEHYAAENPRLRGMSGSIVLARNHEFSDRLTPLADGDEVAFLPPVSGGTGYLLEIADPATGNFAALTRSRIDVESVVSRLLRGEDGAFVDFQGVVRNNTGGRQTRYLDYECYEPMAVKVMAQLVADISARHEVGRVAIVHRLGRLLVGEASVAVVVTSPHRRAAFDAALEAIDRLKKIVPIWKKEHFADGEVWVEGGWDDSVQKAQ